MTDMLKSVEPKSSQLNYDDMISGQSKTIKITKVAGVSGEQPIAISYEGDNGKPYMPCKSMRRVLVHCWGADGHAYVGRSLTLYGDPDVKFGGMSVGGLRISHMSHITSEKTMALTATKASRKPFTVKPLVVDAAPNADEWEANMAVAEDMDKLAAKWKEAQILFKGSKDFARIHAAKEKRKTEIANAAPQ